MKRIILAVLLLSMPLAPAGLTGMTCKPSQQRIAYNTLATIGQSVNASYAAYLDQVVAGKATYSASLAGDYNKFPAGVAVAVQAASSNLSAPAPTDLVNLGQSIINAISTFKK